MLDPTGLGERLLRGGGTEYVELLETLGEAVTIRDSTDRLIYANRAALRHLGFASLEELRSEPLDHMMDQYIVSDENGQPLSMSDIPSVRLLHGQPAEPLLLQTVHRASGEIRWDLLKAAVLRTEGGRPSVTVTVIEDLTAVKTAEVHMRVLSESTRVLASSLDSEQTLRNVTEVAIPGLADWCVVDLVDASGRRTEAVSAHRDPAQREIVAQLRKFDPPETPPDSTLGRVIRSGRAELFAEVHERELAASAHNAEHLALLQALDIRSVMVVPMRIHSRTVAVMSFGTSESRRRLTTDDLAIAEQLAARAAIAMENSRLHTTLSRISETLQQSLLPAELPDLPGWEIASLYRPAGANQRVEVGGDFYEVFAADSAALAVIGDVTGHGVTAATATALLRYGARFAGRLEPHPAAVLSRLDEELRQRPGGTLCTALCTRLSGSELTLSSAGHPPALLVQTDGTVREISTAGPLLGAFADACWTEQVVPVQPGALVVLYTDGVIETPGEVERYGLDSLKTLLGGLGGAAPRQVLDAIDDALTEFRAGDPTDDVAALAFRLAA